MLNNIGLPGLLLIAVVVLVLFGRGKIASLMGEVFKKGVKEGGEEQDEENKAVDAKDVTPPGRADATPDDEVDPTYRDAKDKPKV
jgi:sec-independent protein translocase protein TatA